MTDEQTITEQADAGSEPQGQELAEPKKAARRGRPPKYGVSNVLDGKTNVRVPLRWQERLEALAAQEGVTVAHLMLVALGDYLDEPLAGLRLVHPPRKTSFAEVLRETVALLDVEDKNGAIDRLLRGSTEITNRASRSLFEQYLMHISSGMFEEYIGVGSQD